MWTTQPMRPAPSANALDRPSWTEFERLSWVRALVASVTALSVGFLIGGAAVAPILSDRSSDNEAALKARFERRSVDPQGNYPDPFPYRTTTPDFGTQPGPNAGAYARQQAQRELRGRGAPPPALSAEAAQSFGAAPPSARYQTRDRHTGTAY